MTSRCRSLTKAIDQLSGRCALLIPANRRFQDLPVSDALSVRQVPVPFDSVTARRISQILPATIIKSHVGPAR